MENSLYAMTTRVRSYTYVNRDIEMDSSSAFSINLSKPFKEAKNDNKTNGVMILGTMLTKPQIGKQIKTNVE